MAVPPRISTNSLPLPTRFFNPSRVRSYLLRLPLFTRLILLAIVAFWILELQTVWSVTQWGALIPKEIGFGTMYRLNTFPLIHMGFFHMLMDTICLVPLLERFEAEWGTLTTLALFMGRKFRARLPLPLLPCLACATRAKAKNKNPMGSGGLKKAKESK